MLDLNKIAFENLLLRVGLAFAVVMVCGCVRRSLVDDRPKAEVQFTKYFDNNLETYDTIRNDILKSEFVADRVKQVNTFIKDSLKYQVKEWVAVVNEIKMVNYPSTYSQVEYEILKDVNSEGQFENQIIFYSDIPPRSTRLFQTLRTLRKGDKVRISGKFIPDKNGNVKFDSYLSGSMVQALSGPKFYIYPEVLKLIQ